jgi:hypothetical protein
MRVHMNANLTLEIVRDDNAAWANPRKYCENIGTILYASSRYILGDKQADGDEIGAIERDPQFVYLPVYTYMHGPGNVALSTHSFGCPWDSGKSGIIYVSRADAASAWELPELTPEIESAVLVALREEVSEFSDYLSGNVWGFVIRNLKGEVIDSCWGFVGDEGRSEAEIQGKHALSKCL